MATKSVQDDTLLILKRIAALLESNAVVDTARRQRVVVESAPTTTVNSATFAASTDREFLREHQRTNYNTGVRVKLIDI